MRVMTSLRFVLVSLMASSWAACSSKGQANLPGGKAGLIGDWYLQEQWKIPGATGFCGEALAFRAGDQVTWWSVCPLENGVVGMAVKSGTMAANDESFTFVEQQRGCPSRFGPAPPQIHKYAFTVRGGNRVLSTVNQLGVKQEWVSGRPPFPGTAKSGCLADDGFVEIRSAPSPPPPQPPSVLTAGARPSPRAKSARRDKLGGLYSALNPKTLSWLYMLFSDDGRVAWGKPFWHENGTLDFERSFQAASDGSRGKVSMEDDRFSITWAEGTVKHYPIFRTESGDLAYHDGTAQFWPHLPCAQQRLDGRFTWSYSVSVPNFSGGAGTVAGIYRSTSLVLRPDGTFSYANQGGASATSAEAAAPSATSVFNRNYRGNGTYRVQAEYLTLDFDNGTSVQELFQCRDPKLISLGDKALLKDR